MPFARDFPAFVGKVVLVTIRSIIMPRKRQHFPVKRVELHGGTWTGGRHVRGDGFADDREKVNAAQLAGWTVLEYPSDVFYAGPERVIVEVAQAVVGEMVRLRFNGHGGE